MSDTTVMLLFIWYVSIPLREDMKKIDKRTDLDDYFNTIGAVLSARPFRTIILMNAVDYTWRLL